MAFPFYFSFALIIASSVNSLCKCGFSARLHLAANRICCVEKGEQRFRLILHKRIRLHSDGKLLDSLGDILP